MQLGKRASFSRGNVALLVALLAAQPLAFILAISAGSVSIPLDKLFNVIIAGNGGDVKSVILWDIHIPRTIAAGLGGASLAVAGVVLQVFFHNPLADPYILGISSGSSLFVALALLAGCFISAVT